MSHPYFIAAQCKAGQKKNGTNLGPISIKTDYDVTIKSDDFDNDTGYQLLYNSVFEHIKNHDQRIITIGGDHSIATGSVGAINDYYVDNYEKVYIIWIDAHADINTFDTSVTHNTHGMPVAFLLGLCEQTYVAIKHNIKPDQIIYVGLRDLDPPEWEFLEKHNIKYYTMIDVNMKGIDIIISEIIDKIGNDKIHVSLDVDGIDPEFTPSTGTPVGNGLKLDDVLKILNSFDNTQMKTMDLVEFNPLLGTLSDMLRTLESIEKCINAFVKSE